MPRPTPASARTRSCSSAPVPPSQWVWIGHAGSSVGEGRAAEHRQVARRRTAVAARDLDDAGPVSGPPDDRARRSRRSSIPSSMSATKRSASSSLGRRQAPVRGAVEPLVMEPGRARRGGPRSGATARRASPGSGRIRTASCRSPVASPAVAAVGQLRRDRSTSARRKSGDSSTGRPPSMTRCSWAYVTPSAAGRCRRGPSGRRSRRGSAPMARAART